MCLQLLVKVRGVTARNVEKVALAAEAGSKLELALAEAQKNQPLAAFSVTERAGGCGCSLLERPESWKDESWAFKPELLGPLAAVVTRLAKHPRIIESVQADWLGPDRPDRSEESVSLEDLLHYLRAGRIRPGRVYHVRNSA